MFCSMRRGYHDTIADSLLNVVSYKGEVYNLRRSMDGSQYIDTEDGQMKYEQSVSGNRFTENEPLGRTYDEDGREV